MNLVPIKRFSREPTTSDKKYRVGQMALIGRDPSSGAQGDLWYLARFESNGDATWLKLDTPSGDTEKFIPDSGTSPVVPNASNEVIMTGSNGMRVVGGLNTLTFEPDENGYPITPYVVGPVGQAGYQTIQSAIDAATAAGGTNVIWIQPGSYTEDLTITSSITFMSVDGAASITGTHTPPTTGTVTFEGLVLISTTNIIDSNAAGSTTFNINDSFIIIANGYIFNLPNWTGEILMDNCGEGSTNDGVINNASGSSNVKLINVEMGAGSGNTMQLNCGGGFLRFDTCNVNCPVNMVGSGDLIFQNGVKFANTVTIGGSLGGFAIDTQWRTGSAQALVYNTSGNLSISNGEISSTNNPAIGGTGSGTLKLTNISFPDNSVIAGTVNTDFGVTQSGNAYLENISFDEGANLLDADGEVWIGSGAGNPAPATLTAGSGIQITNAANSITIATASGVLVKSGATQSNTASSTTNTFPNDDTIPQITEGEEFITLAYTPDNASNTLEIDFLGYFSRLSSATTITVALFVDSTTDALASVNHEIPTNPIQSVVAIPLRFRVSAGSTSARTYRIRYGGNTSTTYVNQSNNGSNNGDNLYSTLTVREYT